MFWKGEDEYCFELKERNPKTGALTLNKTTAMNCFLQVPNYDTRES